MHFLQKVLAGLIFFSPAVYALATPYEASQKKAQGFTGPAEIPPT